MKIFDFYQDIVHKLRHEIMVTYVHQTLFLNETLVSDLSHVQTLVPFRSFDKLCFHIVANSLE